MKNIIIFLISLAMLFGCKEQAKKPLSGTDWGMITNPSVEVVQSSVVEGWQTDQRAKANCFYSNIAQEGTKSLIISSTSFAKGRWFTKVNLKPWSRYRFTGWIRTETLVAHEGKGASFLINGFGVKPSAYTGNNDWTLIEYEFNTDNDDSAIIECVFALKGTSKGKVWFDNMNLELISTEKIKTSFSIDITQTKEPMESYIYGQFIEHLGKCIYGGIWAEMIEDRKFWYSVGDKESPWKIKGNPDLIEMDSHSSFVGTHTPVIKLIKEGQSAIYQQGLGLKSGMSYSGHIVLKASTKIKSVNLILKWGEQKSESEIVEIKNIDSEYHSFPLKFNSPIQTEDAEIQIRVIGTGKLWIGTLSLMPDNNIKGFRADVLQLLKELDAPVYRWPGGNFVSGYNWKDGIGERDYRPPRKNPAWSGVEHNDVGIHEFMDFCDLLGTEGYIAVNAGLGNAEQARQQVEYVLGAANTTMGRTRANNGKTAPWKVKWWSIGNEMYGDWQLGFMSTTEFVKKHNEFAKSMKSVDSEIKIIAVGELGDWDKMILSNCSNHMDLISEHFYKQDWHGGGLMTHVKQIPNIIRAKAEAHRLYRKEISGLKEKNIKICMDEWNYWYGPHIYGELGTRYFLRDALGIAAGINEFSRNSDMIFMANYAQTVNVIGAIKTNTIDATMASTGQALKMYRHHFGTIPVVIEGEIRPFDVAVTLNKTTDTLMVSIVNATWDSQEFTMDVEGAQIGNQILVYTLTGQDDMAFNTPGEEMNVIISGPEKIIAKSHLSVKPFSATIFKLPLIKNN